MELKIKNKNCFNGQFPTPQLNIGFILTKKKKNSLNLPQWSFELLNSILDFIVNSL